MSRTILVTGANGQLGREMQRAAVGCADSYIFTDIEELDITDIGAIMKFVDEQKVDVIVNCAAYTSVDRAEEYADAANVLNDRAVGYLAMAARSREVTLIHISTDYVFDGEANSPYTEDQPTNPIGVYGVTKLAGERSIIESGCNYIIVRTAWLYSKWGNNFLNTMLRLTSERETLSVVFDQVGSPTYAGDLAEAVVRIISTDQLSMCGVYHFSNEGVCSWYDFAVRIAALSGSSCKVAPIHTCEYPTAAQRPKYSVLDKTKFKSTFGAEIPHWEESLSKAIKEV